MAGAGSSAGPKEATTSASRETWVASSPSSSASGAGGGSGGAAGAGGGGGAPARGRARARLGAAGPRLLGGDGSRFAAGRGGDLGRVGALALGRGRGAILRGAAAGDQAHDLLDGAGALAQRQLEQDEGESEEHVHARNLPLRLAQQPLDRNAVTPFAVQVAGADRHGIHDAGTISLVTSPVSAVTSSTTAYQRSTFAGVSTSTETTGTRRRSCHRTSPCGAWSPW